MTNNRTTEYHKKVAAEIIAMLEKGTAPWQKPWDGIGKTPINGSSGRRYRGINFLRLYIAGEEAGYTDPRWMTFKQITDVGGKVKKGAHGQQVEFWIFEEKLKDQDGNQVYDEQGNVIYHELNKPKVIHSTVFNVEQAEGIPVYIKPNHQWTSLERAETILTASNVPIIHDQDDRNFYIPSKDEIHLTPKESYPSPEAYYATALHEVGHSTGHSSRLNRDLNGRFGSESYAKEELRAEIASFMLCNDLEISPLTMNEQHAAYVGSWIKVLKEDYNEIFRAAADAEKICDFLYERERTLDNENQKHKGRTDNMSEAKASPASEKQLKTLKKLGIEAPTFITTGEASKIITENMKNNLIISEKQLKYCAERNIILPKNSTKDYVIKSIEEHKRTNSIIEYTPPDNAISISQVYKGLAQKQLQSKKTLDDKQIAGEMLKIGYGRNKIAATLYHYSPRCVNDSKQAYSFLDAAEKIPAVKKALAQQNQITK